MIWHATRYDGHTTRYESGEYAIDHHMKGFGIPSCEAYCGDARLGEFDGARALEMAQAACERHNAVPELDFVAGMEARQ